MLATICGGRSIGVVTRFQSIHYSVKLCMNDSWLDEISPVVENPEIPKDSCRIWSHQEAQAYIKDIESANIDIDENNRFVFKDLGNDVFGFNKIAVKLTDYFFGNHYQSVNAIRGEKSIKKGQKLEQRAFQDLKLIRVSSGRGGNGAVSFLRDVNKPLGPPDGGNGGRGGNVYVKVVSSVNSLHRVKRTYTARNGTPGKGSQLDGKNGEDTVIEVPVGTTIRWVPDPYLLRSKLKEINKDNIWLEILNDAETNAIQLFRDSYEPGQGWIFSQYDEEYYRDREFFQDLDKTVINYDKELLHEEIYQDKFPLIGMDLNKVTERPILLLKGGKGGMGNMNFLTKDVRNPRFSKQGRSGITESFLLELKLIADLGLVGLPNAGKSTLLNAISRARPRIGHWEFTTLQPTIGTIYTTIDKDPFTVADIPGIIKGASQNKGMGLDFLRHVERCKGLVFVISLENDPIADIKVLMQELGEKILRNKRKLIIASKADLNDTSSSFIKFKTFIENEVNTIDDKWKILPICATRNENVEACIQLMSEIANVNS